MRCRYGEIPSVRPYPAHEPRRVHDHRLHRSICLSAQRFSALGMTIALLSGSALVPRVAAAEQPATPVQPNAATDCCTGRRHRGHARQRFARRGPGSRSGAGHDLAPGDAQSVCRARFLRLEIPRARWALSHSARALRQSVDRTGYGCPGDRDGRQGQRGPANIRRWLLSRPVSARACWSRINCRAATPVHGLLARRGHAGAIRQDRAQGQRPSGSDRRRLVCQLLGRVCRLGRAAKITRNGGSWQKVKRKKTVIVNNQSREVEYLAWDFSVGFLIELAVFKRTGDASFALYRVLSSAGAEGMFAGGAAGEPHSVPFHDYVSTWPNASCSIGEPHDGQAGGIAQCTTVEPKLSAELDTEFVTTGGGCGSDDAVGTADGQDCGLWGGERDSECGSRLATAREAGSMGHVRRARGGRQHGAGQARGRAARGLLRGPTPPGQHDSTGFARVMSVGLGGSEGDANPSHLKFKTGDAPVGSRLTEVPLLGVQIAVRPLFLFLVDKGDLDTTIGYGGAASLAYDLSSTIPLFDELHLQADFGYLVGSSKESFIPIDLGAHGSFYLSSGLTAELGLGLDVLIANKQTTASGGQEVTWSGTSTGAFVRAGLEHAFSPHWDVAFAVQARAGSSAKLKSDQVPNVTGDAGSLLGGLAMASLGYTL